MIITPKYTIDKPPGDFEKRVFIGGCFSIASILEEIYKAIIDCGFTPIYSLDFGIPEGEIRHYASRLVQQCKYAIFETSLDAGYFFEMEDAKNYSLINLCVWDGHHGTQPRISAMALTHQVFTTNNHSYYNMDALRSLVTDFLINA